MIRLDPVDITKVLTSFPSITPKDEGCVNYLRKILESMGFDCRITQYENGANGRSANLYARYGNNSPNLCFVGHVDVVPPGNLSQWTYPPFQPEIRDGILYARGAVDMKSAIAAFLVAVSDILTDAAEQIDTVGSISLIITSMEEYADKTNGTKAIMEWLRERGEKIDFCIVGEPSCETEFGDAVKIGSRGILSFQIQCHGKQGHVAYPALADNPIDRMVRILNEITYLVLDDGTDYFEPSNCEIISVDVGNTAYNVIPDLITSRLNVRYNVLHTADSLIELFSDLCKRITDKFTLTVISKGAEPFRTNITKDIELMRDTIKKHVGIDAKINTTGGTSDARFVHPYCNFVEFGLVSKTAHQINENTAISDLYKLTDIYREFILKFFQCNLNKN